MRPVPIPGFPLAGWWVARWTASNHRRVLSGLAEWVHVRMDHAPVRGVRQKVAVATRVGTHVREVFPQDQFVSLAGLRLAAHVPDLARWVRPGGRPHIRWRRIYRREMHEAGWHAYRCGETVRPVYVTDDGQRLPFGELVPIPGPIAGEWVGRLSPEWTGLDQDADLHVGATLGELADAALEGRPTDVAVDTHHGRLCVRVTLEDPHQ